MFNQNTLLILGAGASVDYGFPTGKKLIKDIIENRNLILDEFAKLLSDDFKELANTIVNQESALYQIDSLCDRYYKSLIDHRNFIEIRHFLLICDSISSNLNKSELKQPPSQYYFWEKIRDNILDGIDKPLYKILEDIEAIYKETIKEKELIKYKKSSPKEVGLHFDDYISKSCMQYNIQKEFTKDLKVLFQEHAKKYLRALEFFKVLQEFDPISIDSFLSIHPEFNITLKNKNLSIDSEGDKKVNIGKFAISYEICKHMSNFDDKLLNNSVDEKHNNWYRYLLNKILEGHHRSHNKKNFFYNILSKLKIITFNYDTSLEYYLYNKLSKISYFNKDSSNPDKGNHALDFINTFIKDNIYHVYGKIDYEQFLENEEYDYKFIYKQSEKIKTINEERGQDENQFIPFLSRGLEVGRNYLEETITLEQIDRNIFIIGYALNEDNNMQIKLEDIVRINQYERGYRTNNIVLLNADKSSIIDNLFSEPSYDSTRSEVNNTIKIVYKYISDAIGNDFDFS